MYVNNRLCGIKKKKKKKKKKNEIPLYLKALFFFDKNNISLNKFLSHKLFQTANLIYCIFQFEVNCNIQWLKLAVFF